MLIDNEAEKPSYAGFISYVLLKVLCLMTQNFYYGTTSNFVHKDK